MLEIISVGNEKFEGVSRESSAHAQQHRGEKKCLCGCEPDPVVLMSERARKAAFARLLVIVLPVTMVAAMLSKHLMADMTRRMAISELYHSSDEEALRPEPLDQHQYLSSAISCSDSERASLFRAGVRLAGNSPNWLLTSGWGEAADCCDWKGVQCTSGRVSSLTLSNQGLRGHVPVELGMLGGLTSLDLNENAALSGTLPSEVLGPSLKHLFCFGCAMLSGSLPSHLPRRSSSLQELELSRCRLSGTLPAALGSALNLRYVFLESNRLSGTLPSQISHLRHLKELELSHNRLSGSVPGALSKMPLQHFDVASNAPSLKGAPTTKPTSGCSGGSEKYLRGTPRGAGAGSTPIVFGQGGVPHAVQKPGELSK